MKKEVTWVFLTVISMMMLGSTFAQEIPTVPLNKPINPKLINNTGSWNYEASMPSVKGMCPAGNPASGTCSLTKGGDGYTLVFLSGRVCKPASMCTFKGTLSGNELVLSNTDTVDKEGGTVTNALRLTVYTNGHLSGEGSSRYIHPEGFECQWSHGLTLTRKSGR